ncbi:MAG: putative glycosyltransferase EpsF [Firmicutes bacterium ADurb.Bin099]|nr:MAG: putative glycosyltransferase EpsF [Firmicutes bacterium ADurb.Bin099]
MKRCVTHLITGLGMGGAETMLYQVLKYSTNSDLQHRVISFGASHFYEQLIRNMGISVIEVDIKKKPLTSLARILHEIKGTDTLCCWMYHANLIGYYLGHLSRVKKIVWCIRHSNLDADRNSKLTMSINRHCAKISKSVSKIAYNGQTARFNHEAIGYCKQNGVVVDNGVDCELYKPDSLAQNGLRQEFHITDNQKIILSVTRDNPIKDIPTFLEAISILHRSKTDIVAVMCGAGISCENKRIVSLCEQQGLQIGKDIFLLGTRNDVARLLAGCDVYALHSAGEAFPNTLIQAMACGCLCIATDVGEVRRVLNNDQWIVPAKNPKQLAAALLQAQTLTITEKKEIAYANRARVKMEYDIDRIVKQYEEILK